MGSVSLNGSTFMKRITLTAISFMVLLSLFSNTVNASNTTFKDVPRDHWAHDEIRFLSSKGVIKGFASGEFKPLVILTRKDAAIMLVRAMRLKAPSNPKIVPSDMKPTMGGYKEVLTVMEKGMFTLNGKSFMPDKPLTRKEMAKAIAVAYNYKGAGKSSFKDLPKSNPYYTFIDAIAENDVTSGYKDGTFKPEVPVSRAQFSVFLARIYSEPLEYAVKENGKVLHKVRKADQAIDLALKYPKATVHPVSNSLMNYDNQTGMMTDSGIGNGVLIYNGNENPMKFTPEFFEPYISIKPNDGSRRPLFDTFIILGRSYPNGEFGQISSNHANFSEWRWYAERTFAADGTLENLNSAAKQQGKKANVYIAIPYPKQKEAIIDLDGKKRANNLNERSNLITWYMNDVQSKWQKAGYSNLTFKGYYWLNETVGSLEDELLVEKTAKSIHSQNKKFIYSPHALSNNFENWKIYGFDGVYLQPNTFRLKLTDTQKRLHLAFLRAQVNGIGINIEIDTYSPHQMASGVQNFAQYVEMAERYGLPGRSLIFYQGNEMVYRMGTYNLSPYQEGYQLMDRVFK
ncbi:DUF4855 domain-containing protein [Heyndrickxia sp. MSNUG]|uniref:DUF4855 domain-containing protein n=1 Tax=Heyndrickxia sp. MSNUG TaxID=3136677 RepID=UPI003C2C44A7